MPYLIDRLTNITKRLCCRPPQPPRDVQAGSGGGSGEASVSWLPGPTSVTFYRVYRFRSDDIAYHLAVVLPGALGLVSPGRVGVIDAPDYFPWASSDAGNDGDRTYRVTAISNRGLESAFSAPATVAGPFS